MAGYGGSKLSLDEIQAIRTSFDTWHFQKQVDARLGLRRDDSGRLEPTPAVAGESQGHAALKQLVARAAAGCGWRPSLEVAGDGWRADVLLERGLKRLAIEVQLSPQNLRDYQERHRRYAAAGLPCVWLVGGYPDGYVP